MDQILQTICEHAKNSKYEIGLLSEQEKNHVLGEVAKQLTQDKSLLLEANQIDLENAEKSGMHPGLVDRLRLTPERIQGMVDGLYKIIELPDPVGEVLETIERPNGLILKKTRVPLGVIGIIYESRPNVTLDAFGLVFKSGNVVVLKGGSDAIHSNKAIVESIRRALSSCGITEFAVSLIEATDRETTKEFMKCKDYIDVLIPRGGAGLIRTVVENSTIPVIETGTGNCHLYVDDSADLDMAISILENSKTQRIGVCNACESLLVHEAAVKAFLPRLKALIDKYNIQAYGDDTFCHNLDHCIPATEEEYGKEFLDYAISIKTVSSVKEAIAHINRFNTKHSETIVTGTPEHAEQFLNEVDAACVYVNASTRFTDGFEFGFGAEIGISTQMLHARGPMGLKELTSYKYKIYGNGQIRK